MKAEQVESGRPDGRRRAAPAGPARFLPARLGAAFWLGLALIAARTDAAGPASATSVAPGTSAGSTPDAAAAKRLAALRKKVLSDEDFVENEETNRDPFHPYRKLFADQSVARGRKAPAVFEKAGLDELALIAIVSGDDAPRAMFRDATGIGRAVKRGDYISRAGARVTKILSDRVIVELTETATNGEPRVVEKAILVNPEQPQ